MTFLIWVIIIIALIVHSYKKSQKQKETYKKQQNASDWSRSSPAASRRKKTEKPKEDVLTRAKRNVAEDFDTPRAQAPSAAKTKERLVHKYQDQLKQKPPEPSQMDIRLEAEPIPAESAEPQVFDSGDTDLMKNVQDLIVKGYEPKLSFERDFISEGIDLLNKYY